MPASSKNIVICSDGTGQSYHGNESNVLRLYRLARKDTPDQLVCYDPGVGTHPLPTGPRTRFGRAFQHYVGELFLGRGVMDNVAHLYRFLMEHYEPGDRIFLFGFSRGAFTVRALAGLIHFCGLLRRGDGHLVDYATGIYETSELRIAKQLKCLGGTDRTTQENEIDHAKLDPHAKEFKALLSRECPITFLGIWDTVKAYGWLRPRSFPALRHNPSVAAVRHALALNERRSLFQVTTWGDRHKEVKEVWFAGDHSDVGGGHACNSALADAAMTWMLGEASHCGLLLDRPQRSVVDRIVENGRFASQTPSKNLLKGGYKIPFPRIELNNASYPPARYPHIWPVGVRRPADHAPDSPILLHHTLQGRPQKYAAFRTDTLLWDVKTPIQYEPDQVICWDEEEAFRASSR